MGGGLAGGILRGQLAWERVRSPPTAISALGKLHCRIGKPEDARENLTAATTMYREMGMDFWIEQEAR